MTRTFALVAAPVAFALLAGFLPAEPSAAAPPTTASSAAEFVGLWKATRRYGPDARGPLIIVHERNGWIADFVGRTTAVGVDRRVLTFSLPDEQGSFRGELRGDNIAGRWTAPNSVINGSRYAVPVRLVPDGPDRWGGQVVPRDDDFTLYLKIFKRADGTIGAFLRNPERNIGTQINLDRIVRRGDAVSLMGKSNGSGRESALLSGSYDPENQILTIAFPQRGGTYDLRRDDDPQTAFYPRGASPAPYVYRPPLARGDGWPTGTLAEANIDVRGIERFVQRIEDTPIDSVHAPEVDGILIARHGKLVLEEYFHGFSRDRLHETRSAAKSLTATIVGAALQAGVPLSLTSRVYEVMNGGALPPGLEPRKQAMTLEDLLMMRSGFFCDDGNPAAPGNEENMLEQSAEPDYYRYTLAVPMAFPPDRTSIYCSANPNLALGMVGRAMRESPMDVFDRLLGDPLKINYYAWPLDPAGNPYGGGGMQMFPRDFMKLGQLMLNRGMWNGRRILSNDFVARASAPLHDMNGIQYGYLWWNVTYPYKNRTIRGFFAGGNGGQLVMVLPDLDLVIAAYAGNYADRVGLHIQQDLVPRYILPAVREPGDDPSAPLVEPDFSTPYGRAPGRDV